MMVSNGAVKKRADGALERAAVALMNRQRSFYDLDPVGVGMFDVGELESAKDLARAVLMAVRDPGDGPLDAACDVGPDTNNGVFSYDDARTVFTAMIDAILNERAQTNG